MARQQRALPVKGFRVAGIELNTRLKAAPSLARLPQLQVRQSEQIVAVAVVRVAGQGALAGDHRGRQIAGLVRHLGRAVMRPHRSRIHAQCSVKEMTRRVRLAARGVRLAQQAVNLHVVRGQREGAVED